MRRIHLGVLTLALPLLAASVLVVGCGKDTKPEGGGDKGGDGGGPKAKTEMKAVVAKGGSVRGKITLKGSPDLKAMTKKLQAEMDQKKDKDECHRGEPFEQEEYSYRIGDNKQVGNVFVWLGPADKNSEYFKLDDKQVKDLENHPVTIDQPHCAFIPHCAVCVPSYRDPKNPSKQVPTGQKVTVKNSAKMSHNTKVASLNQIIQPGKEEDLTLKVQKNEYEVACTIHPWMRGYIRTFDHPYATVSLSESTTPKAKPGDDSFGTYEIKNTPVGKLRIFAWHETKGFLNKGGDEGEEITIKEGPASEKSFELEAE